jgi:hypothetical protein
MTKRDAPKQPINEPSELESKVQQADPMIKQAFSEYQKEIVRLQKQLVKEHIAHESEKAHLLERIKKEKVHVTIQNFAKKIHNKSFHLTGKTRQVNSPLGALQICVL